MARLLRIERVSVWFDITGGGNERRAIYRDHRDRQHFCELQAEMVGRFRLRPHAFVLVDRLGKPPDWLNCETEEPSQTRTVQSGLPIVECRGVSLSQSPSM